MNKLIKISLLAFIFPVFTYTQKSETDLLRNQVKFPLGASVDADMLLTNKRYRDVANKEFNSITAENHMKMYIIHPEQNRYDFSAADSIVDFALKNGKRVHGHTLVWFDGTADWLKNFKGTDKEFSNEVKKHIQTVVKHYKGKVTSWDVVNEYLSHNGDSVRDCIFTRRMGKAYLAQCFQWAHEADPKAILIYNEYGMEWSEKKLQAMKSIALDFLKRKIPIHGLGVQFHVKTFDKDEQIVRTLTELSQTGLKIHISELDVMVNGHNQPIAVYTDSLKQLQTEKFKLIFDAYRKQVPDKQQHGITFWNIADNDTWLRKVYKISEWPLLFDDNYIRKPAYYKVLEKVKSY
jgi:endo-1,4-beta-xylanase